MKRHKLLEKILTHSHFGKGPIPRVQLCPSHGGFDCPNPRRPVHVCPYKEDILGDLGTLCACCSDCERACMEEI